jgi:hypothetical protein
MKYLRMGSVGIPHYILTTRTEPWGFIKLIALYLSVLMQLCLCLSFYLRRSHVGYIVGTTKGFPIEIMDALAPESHRQISWKCPHYYMSTCSVHRRVIDSTTHSTEGSRATIGVMYPGSHGPPFTAQNSGYDQFLKASNG